MTLPEDPFILYSFINTHLRDNYPSLKELCAAACVSKEEIVSKLAAAGFSYDEDMNRFV